MTFVSVQFGLLLLFSLIAYHLLPARWRALLLLVASYVFYAYWNPWYLWLILLSTGIDYTAALFMESHPRPAARRLALWASVAGNLGLLGYFKYTNFGLQVLHELLPSAAAGLPQALDIILPVGISFYTFQSMSYTIDVYRGHLRAERSFVAFALFVSFFPQLVAGPIERAADLLPQLKKQRPSDPAQIEFGVRMLLWGFAKKLIVADRLLAAAQPILLAATPQTAPDLLFSTLALFTMVYFDFSAYTDMARGTAALFGVRLAENFRLPLVASSIAEFWRGWHITLSTWVRDYVYVPLGGGRPQGWPRQALLFLVTMGLVGLWHGANWTYIVWGLQQGLLLFLYMMYALKIRRRLKRKPWFDSRWFALLGWTFTMLLHAIGMAWFFSPDLPSAAAVIARFFTPGAWVAPIQPATIAGGFILPALWAFQALARRWPLESMDRLPPAARGLVYAALLVAILGLGVSRSATFIYFQF